MIQIIVINLICCIAFPVFVFWKARIYGQNSWNTNALTRDDTWAMRGIAAFFVLFAHLLIAMSEAGIGKLGPAVLYKWCGGLGVCVFFFVSGYGLWVSYEKKKIQIDFIKKRMMGMLPTYFLIRIIAIICLRKFELGGEYTLLYLFSLRESAWFVVEILLIYLFFYIVMRYGRNHAILNIFIALFVMSVVFLLFDLEPRWYNANLNFGFGALLAKYRSNYISIVTKNEKRFWLISMGMLLAFGGTALTFSVFKGCLWANAFKLLAGGFFSLSLVNIALKIDLRSKGLLQAGKYSLQFYLLHLIVIEWFGQKISNDANLLGVFVLELAICLFVIIVYCWCEKKIFR